VQGETAYTGNGNSNANPLFINNTNAIGEDGIYGTSDDGFTLKANSPAINTANPASNSLPKDMIGNPRVGFYDMGAYEYQIANYVKNPPMDDNQMCIYPNPATEGFIIHAGEQKATVCIYDLRGVLVLTQQVTGECYVDITSLKQGVYMVKTNGLIKKIVKNN
jgi:hypothetical protein